MAKFPLILREPKWWENNSKSTSLRKIQIYLTRFSDIQRQQILETISRYKIIVYLLAMCSWSNAHRYIESWTPVLFSSHKSKIVSCNWKQKKIATEEFSASGYSVNSATCAKIILSWYFVLGMREPGSIQISATCVLMCLS